MARAMHEVNVALLLVAGSALLLGLLSKRLKRIGVPDALTLLALGIAAGPAGLGLLDPHGWGRPMAILEQVARLALAVGLMGVALRLPRDFVIHQWRSLLVVLGVGMPFMWLCSSLVAGGLLGLSLGAALLVGAALTPTDPVIASTIVTGPVAQENLPARLRHTISAESGANDGLALLFVMGATFIVAGAPGGHLGRGLAVLVGWQILGAVALGAAIGWAAGRALRLAEEHDIIEQPSVLLFTTALALTTLAVVKLAGSDGILAVFVAGLAFDRQVDVRERQQEERVVEGVDRFFISPILLLLGLMLPWQAWGDLGWSAVFLVLAVLILRRLPLFLLLGGRLAGLPRRADGAFSGWFGPVGVAAVYYAALAHHHADVPVLWPAVSLVATASIAAHGLSAMPLSRLYGRIHGRG